MAVFIPKGETEYSCNFRLSNRKQVIRKCGTKREAEAKRFEALLRVRLEQELKDAADEARRKAAEPKIAPFLRDFARVPDPNIPGDQGGHFWENYGNAAYENPKTKRFYRCGVGNLLKFAPFDVRLNEIEAMAISGYVGFRKKQPKVKKIGTVYHDLSVLKVILNKAVEWGFISHFPKITIGEQDKIGMAIPMHDEDAYLAASPDDDHRLWVLLQIETAMMPCEAAALRWTDVKLGPDVEAFGGLWEDGVVYDRCEKTQYRARPLAMTPKLAVAMQAQFDRRDPANPYVFPAARSGVDRLSSFQTAHQRIWQRNLLPGVTRFRIYDLRHTALTRANESGAGLMELLEMGGWNSIEMAQRYIKVSAMKRASTAKKMSEHTEKLREAEQRRRVVNESAQAVAAAPTVVKPAATVVDFAAARQKFTAQPSK
jgi:integrase